MAGWGERRAPNAWVAEERPAPSLTSRIEMLLTADAWVAVAGGVGTLAEAAVAWNCRQAGENQGRMLVLMGPRWAAILRALEASLIVEPRDLALVRLADDPDAVVACLQEAGGVLGDDPGELAVGWADPTGG
jgi:predicted Rossmann-fold nucleotide-binding protein